MFTWNNGAANQDWDTTSLNWSGSAWTNGATGVGTVTLAALITNNAITFNTAGYTLTGGTLSLAATTNSASYPDIYFGNNQSGTADYGVRLASPVNLGSGQRYLYGKTGRNGVTRYLLTGCDAQFAGSISGSGGLTFIGQNRFGPGVNIMEVPFALNASNSFTGTLEIQRGSVYPVIWGAMLRRRRITGCSGIRKMRRDPW